LKVGAMKLGILADIHEHVEWLRPALDLFRSRRVDRVIVLGDVYCMGKQIHETAALLAAAGAVGVWGNHDLGLCCEPPESIRRKYAGPVLDYMTTLRPRLEVNGCLFTHVEPWLNPEVPEEIWWIDGPPDSPERAAQSFNAVPHRHLFVGHFHRWLILTPTGVLPWRGEEPISLKEGRYFVVVAGVAEGRCAIFDTATQELTPIDFTREAIKC
jgi:hypothetical protein